MIDWIIITVGLFIGVLALLAGFASVMELFDYWSEHELQDR